MNIIVLIKQVPEIEKVRFDYEKGRLDRSSAAAVINPFDLNALEAAVQLKEKYDGNITVLSMGPKQAESSLRDAVARGADNAVLLTDSQFAGADTLATSYTLACAVKKIGDFDLIICGEKTVDGDTAQVGPEVAEFLGIPHVAYVELICEANNDHVKVRSRMEKNDYLIELKMPALITVNKDANSPRLPTLKGKLNARKTNITIWNANDLAVFSEFDRFGLRGSPTWVVKVFAPKTGKKHCQKLDGSAEIIAKKIINVLKENGVLK